MKSWNISVVIFVLISASASHIQGKGKRDSSKKSHPPVKQPQQPISPKETQSVNNTNKVTAVKSKYVAKKPAKATQSKTGESFLAPTNITNTKTNKKHEKHFTKKGTKNGKVTPLKKLKSKDIPVNPKDAKSVAFSQQTAPLQNLEPTQSGTLGLNSGMAQETNPVKAGPSGPSMNPALSGSFGHTAQQSPSGQATQPGSLGQVPQQVSLGQTPQQAPLGQATQQSLLGQTPQQGPMGQISQQGSFDMVSQMNSGFQGQPNQQEIWQSGNTGSQYGYNTEQNSGLQSPFYQRNPGQQQSQYDYTNLMNMQSRLGQQNPYQMQNQNNMQPNFDQQMSYGNLGQQNIQGGFQQSNPYGYQGSFGFPQSPWQSLDKGMPGAPLRQEGSYSPNPYPQGNRYPMHSRKQPPTSSKPLRHPKQYNINKMKDVLMPGSPPQTWHNPTCFYKGRYYTPGKVIEVKMKLKKVLVCVLTCDLCPVIGTIPLSTLPCWPKMY